MKQIVVACVIVLSCGALAPAWAQQASDAELALRVLEQLNRHDTIKGIESSKNYKLLFDAYLNLAKPPFEIGELHNHNLIYPGMPEWSAFSGWAESNTAMADAIIACKDTKFTKFGLPYGREALDQKYVSGGLYADVADGGSLREWEFPYLHAIDVIAAYTTAECYRLMEANQTQRALDLSVAFTFLVRQLSDREFLAEKMHSIQLLSDMLANLRDLFYVYQDKIDAGQFRKVGESEIPFLRPDRGRLFMPEADRIVAQALIEQVFTGARDQADPDKFTSIFAGVQSKDAPLTRFGAAKRWRMIANIHGSRQASLERLKLIYDDWWRRWRIEAYDDILSHPTQYELTNPIRYAAVIYSLQNVEDAFQVRNMLVAQVNGTALAAGLCAYNKTFGTYPDQLEKTYAQFIRKRSDLDPYDKELRALSYRVLDNRHAIDTRLGRLWIEEGQPLLYALGQDHADDRGAEHSDDGEVGDVVLWPPIKPLWRDAGMQ